MHEFAFQEMNGEVLKGSLDLDLIDDAMNRFRHARKVIPGTRLDILEFPFAKKNQPRPAQDNVFVRYCTDKKQFDIKVYSIGRYNTKRLIGHFVLYEHKPKSRYEMTIS